VSVNVADIVIAKPFVPVPVAPSVTCTKKVNVVAVVVGVPVIAPVLGFRLNPVGNDPEATINVYPDPDPPVPVHEPL
jgi:hypothetical protein